MVARASMLPVTSHAFHLIGVECGKVGKIVLEAAKTAGAVGKSGMKAKAWENAEVSKVLRSRQTRAHIVAMTLLLDVCARARGGGEYDGEEGGGGKEGKEQRHPEAARPWNKEETRLAAGVFWGNAYSALVRVLSTVLLRSANTVDPIIIASTSSPADADTDVERSFLRLLVLLEEASSGAIRHYLALGLKPKHLRDAREKSDEAKRALDAVVQATVECTEDAAAAAPLRGLYGPATHAPPVPVKGRDGVFVPWLPMAGPGSTTSTASSASTSTVSLAAAGAGAASPAEDDKVPPPASLVRVFASQYASLLFAETAAGAEQSRAKRKMVAAFEESLARRQRFAGCRLEIYGSSRSNFGSLSSDTDICMIVPLTTVRAADKSKRGDRGMASLVLPRLVRANQH